MEEENLVLFDRNEHRPVSKLDGQSIRMWEVLCTMPVLVDLKTGKVYQDGMQIACVEFGYKKTICGWKPKFI